MQTVPTPALDRDPGTRPVPELELLRIKAAHLELQVAQLQAQMQLTTLSTAREALIRKTLLAYVSEEEVEQYVIDLASGTIRPREEPPTWQNTP